MAPDPDDIDRASQIMRAAVKYASLNGAYNGAWRAEHTGNSVLAEIEVESVCRRRDQALRRLTRLMDKASTVRSVELWSIASVASVLVDEDGKADAYGLNLEPFEFRFLRSFLELIERDCEHRRNAEDRKSAG